MSEVEPNVLKALETKLVNLVRCVIDHAATDATLAQQLEKVLLSESLSTLVREKKKVKKKAAVFAPVPFLHEHGEEGLRMELDKFTDHDLRLIIRSEGSRRVKEVDANKRLDLVSEIVAHSTRRLHQGSTFLK